VLSGSSTGAETALPIARALAEANPRAMLPCPLCAAGVRGENLAGHVSKAHPGNDVDAGGGPMPIWTGAGRRPPVLVFLPFAIAAVVAALGPVAHLLAPAAVVAVGLALAAGFGLLAASLSGVFSARMTFDGRALSVRHRLGLRCRRVFLPAELEIGSISERRSDTSGPGETLHSTTDGDRRLGGYLRVHGATGSITVLARKTSLGQYWDGPHLQNGPRRRLSDITLDAAGFGALTYLLASAGMLSLRRR